MCNFPDCHKEAFICSKCINNGVHDGHVSINYSKLRTALIKFVSNILLI